MSILGAIKAQSGTLTDLAKLPQALIMQMAQKGQIAQDMVMPILSKKAEMVEAARAMQNAQQQGGVPPTTVLEQIMQQNAVAEQPAPQMRQERGLETLDTGRMNPEQYAGGGIVAFDGGGEVPSYAGMTDGSVVGDPDARRKALLVQLQKAQRDGDTISSVKLQEEIRSLTPENNTFTAGLRRLVEGVIPSAAAGERTEKGYVDDPMVDSVPRKAGAPVVKEVPVVAPPPKPAPKLEVKKEDPAGIVTVAPVKKPKAAAKVVEPPKKELAPVEVTASLDLDAPVFKPQLLTGRGFDTAQDKARTEEFATAYGVDKEYFNKQRTKLEEEGREIPKEQEQAKWMALAEAGLAIAAGDSPYALQNIAKGGGKGLEAYKGYQKDIKEKQRLLKDRNAKITEAEQLEKRGQANAAMGRRDEAAKYDERIEQFNATAMAKAEENNLKATFELQKIFWDRLNFTNDEKTKFNRELTIQGITNQAAMARVAAQIVGQRQVAEVTAGRQGTIPAKDVAKLRMEVEAMYGPGIKKELKDKYGSNAKIDTAYRAQIDAKIREVMGESPAPAASKLSPETLRALELYSGE